MRMTTTQCRDRFSSAMVARLGTVTASGDPHLVPVTFAVIDTMPPLGARPTEDMSVGDSRLVVFAVDHKPKSTPELRRLDNIAANPGVAFLVDYYDEDWEKLWWVRADATAAILGGADRQRAVAGLRAKYPQYERYAPQGVVVGARVTGWTGWRFARDGGG